MEALHQCRFFLTPDEERALFNHLYELHKLRDEEIRQDVLTILDNEGHFDTFDHFAEL